MCFFCLHVHKCSEINQIKGQCFLEFLKHDELKQEIRVFMVSSLFSSFSFYVQIGGAAPGGFYPDPYLTLDNTNRIQIRPWRKRPDPDPHPRKTRRIRILPNFDLTEFPCYFFFDIKVNIINIYCIVKKGLGWVLPRSDHIPVIAEGHNQRDSFYLEDTL